jgi:predicted RNase H-like nuclease
VTERGDLLSMAEGSIDLEGLPQASPEVRELLDRWAGGEASTQDLLDAEELILTRESASSGSAPGAPRAA